MWRFSARLDNYQNRSFLTATFDLQALDGKIPQTLR